MIKNLLSALLLFLLLSCGSNEPNACLIAEDFIKKDLAYPEEAEFSLTRCNKETNTDGTYNVLTYVVAKNAMGVKSKVYYKLKLSYNGGVTTDMANWTLLSMRSEKE